MTSKNAEFLVGLDHFVQSSAQKLKGQRVALLANQATVDSSLAHAVDLLHSILGTSLVRIFGPEHGFRGDLQDMESVEDSIDKQTGLSVRSLYGCSEETLKPQIEDLKDLDVLIVDLPDIGARYYTYAQTLAYCMQVAKEAECRVIVLDRPNPISGSEIEGSPLLTEYRSFCGLAPVAARHGLTLGELAKMFNEGFELGEDSIPALSVDLEIVPCQGWSRELYFDQTPQHWVYPSPNMPTLDTAIIYPGSCLFEGTEISEGRGTTKPLQMFGAPYIDGAEWASATLELGVELEGAILRPTNFVPKFQKFAEQVCGGLELHVSDRLRFKPFRWALALIYSAKQVYPEQFAWRKQAYEFLTSIPAIDLLYGSDAFRVLVENGASLSALFEEIEAFESSYIEARKPYLLY